MEIAPIRMMNDFVKGEMIPIDRIKAINSWTRDEGQFSLNVQSIEAIGLIKTDIRVNDKFLAKDGWGEPICGEGRLIAHQRMGKTHILRGSRYLHPKTGVPGIARGESRPESVGDDGFWFQIKTRHDEVELERMAKVACRSVEYTRQ